MIPKFRAWQKSTQSMRDVLVIDYLNGMVDLEGGEIEQYLDDIELMQSTGLKDNNDTEVFERDVINVHWFYADYDPVELGAFENEEEAERVVVTKEFGNLGFWWNDGDTWLDLATLAMSARLDEESFEILGNIYENPELLEGK